MPLWRYTDMATTIDGGAALVIGLDGSERWIDSEGRPLNAEQVSAAKKIAAENTAAIQNQDRAALALEAQRDPTARAIAAALAPQAPKAVQK